MRRSLLILPAAAAAVAIAGCGGYSAGTPASSAAQATTAASTHAMVATRHGKLGTFLVDGHGHTLYRFLRDTSPRSHCSGACAVDWPPLTTKAAPKAGGGVKASALSTSKRADGSRQVVYHGRPLYRFAPDTAPGQTGGEGLNEFGGRWYVVSPSGRVITAAPASTPSMGSSY